VASRNIAERKRERDKGEGGGVGARVQSSKMIEKKKNGGRSLGGDCLWGIYHINFGSDLREKKSCWQNGERSQ